MSGYICISVWYTCVCMYVCLSLCLCIILARSHASVASECDNLSAISLTLLLFRYLVILLVSAIPLARVNLAAIYANLLRIFLRILFSFGSKATNKTNSAKREKKEKKNGKNKYLNLSKKLFYVRFLCFIAPRMKTKYAIDNRSKGAEKPSKREHRKTHRT